MAIEELKRAVIEISKMCEKCSDCDDCPFWDDALQCRLQASWPQTWWLEDWMGGQKK